MEFFKPTWRKIIIAFVLTIWPYVASLVFVLFAHDGNIFSDPLVRYSFWFHTWYWSPLYLIFQIAPNHVYRDDFWQSNMFLFFYYPLVRFFFRYLVACLIIFIAKKVSHKHAAAQR
ncbi:MAG TPA: hypothetical protein VLF93_01345 [Candidatus Saccharimonadales bacterium]|nr:hypothetical protein [Candidatus Saccharimonadales bacterium]